jgi:hypothetical protein
MSQNIDLKALPEVFSKVTNSFKRYRLVLFLLFFAGAYGFLVWQINTLSNAAPSSDQVAAKLQGSNSVHIDQSVIDKMQQLQDNSVNVQSLFEKARENPFQE